MTTPRDLDVTAHLLEAPIAAGRGEAIALVEGERRWTYRQLHERACRFADALRRSGLGPGDRMLILSGDRLEWVAAFLGAIRADVRPVPLNTWFPAPDYDYYLADSEATALCIDTGFARSHPASWRETSRLKRIILIGDDVEATREALGPAGECAVGWEAFIADASPDVPPREVSPRDPAFWLYSSGTTGRSKGVVHSQESMTFSAENYGQGVLGLTSEDRVFSVAKLFFAYGLGNALYFPLFAGASSILYSGRCTPAVVADILERERPTVFYAVPTFYAAFLQWLDANPDRDPPVGRLCVSAGEPLPAEICSRWMERFGVDILDGIGSTEMVHIFISNRPGAIVPGSTGVPVEGYEARILDDAGAPCADGDIGNLWVRGRSAFLEYWRRAEATATTIVDGWVRTGDKYRRDGAGTYWYAGRSDDMLKVSGLWVSPFEVEAAIAEHPRVLEAAVIGIEDDAGLVKPHAHVILRDGVEPAPEVARDIQDFVKSRLAPYMYPREIVFTEDLPRTATGKIQRYRLREAARRSRN